MTFHAIVPFQSLRNERFGGSSISIFLSFFIQQVTITYQKMQTLSIMNLKVDMGYIPTFQVSPFANQPSSFIVDLLLIIGS
jgi:hypothetical protein